MRGMVRALLAAVFVAGCGASRSGNELPPPVVVAAPTPVPTPATFVHRVQFRGQTLGQISKWYTGKYENWKQIVRMNDDLTLPNAALRVGREVKIPLELVVRKAPMPPPRRKQPVAKAGAAPKPDDEFGNEEPSTPSEGEAAAAPSDEAASSPAQPSEPAAEPPPIIGPK
jgi:hypothetical protein